MTFMIGYRSVAKILKEHDIWRIQNQLDATYYFIVLLIGSNMLRALLCPSSGARDYDVDYHISRFVLGLLYVGG